MSILCFTILKSRNNPGRCNRINDKVSKESQDHEVTSQIKEKKNLKLYNLHSLKQTCMVSVLSVHVLYYITIVATPKAKPFLSVKCEFYNNSQPRKNNNSQEIIVENDEAIKKKKKIDYVTDREQRFFLFFKMVSDDYEAVKFVFKKHMCQ